MGQGLAFTYETIDHLPEVQFLKVEGSIDSDTAPAFEAQLQQQLNEGHVKIMVDLEAVDYISSAGVGIFVGMVGEFRDHPQGDIKVCHVSSKIRKVFTSIGLDGMIELYDTPAQLEQWSGGEAIVDELDHFTLSLPSGDDVYRGNPVKLRVEAHAKDGQLINDYHDHPGLTSSPGMVLPGELRGFKNGLWEGEITVNGSGKLTLTVEDRNKKGQLDVEVQEKTEKAIFPLTVKCSTCAHEIVVTAPDLYRCEHCDETFQIDEWGHQMTIRSGSLAKRRKSKYKGMELKINADVNYMSVIRVALKGLCEKEGMSPETTNEVVLAVEEILLNLMEHGNDFDPWQILVLRVHFQKKQVKIQIRDYGDPFDITKQDISTIKSNVMKGKKRGVGAFMVNQIMDQVKYSTLPNYNELTMVKRYGPEDEND